MIGFGINTTGANVLRSSTENLFVNAVAKISPLASAGYFNQSYKLQNVLSSVCNTVIDGALFPILSKESDGNIIRHSTMLNYYSMTILSLIVFFLLLNIDFVVLLFLGEKWLGTIPFLKVFFAVGLLQTYTALNRNLLKSLGITFDILILETISSVVCLLLMFHWGKDVDYLMVLLSFYVVLRFVLSIIALHINKIVSIVDALMITLKATLPSILSFILCIVLIKTNLTGSIVLINLIFFISFCSICKILGLSIFKFVKRIKDD